MDGEEILGRKIKPFGMTRKRKKKTSTSKLLNNLRRNKPMPTETPVQKPSVLPQALKAITEQLHENNELLHGIFEPAPEYLKDKLREVRVLYSEIIKDLTEKIHTQISTENGGKKEAPAPAEKPQENELVKTVSEVKAALESKGSAMAGDLDKWLFEVIKGKTPTLTPSLIKANLDTFRLVENKCDIIANEDHVILASNGTKFRININGTEYESVISFKKLIPTNELKLYQV